VLATSPEILVFLFFMLTDPKTVPAGQRARIAFAVSVALLAALLIAPARTEFWAKVGVLGALAVVCAARAALAEVAPSLRPAPPRLAVLAVAGTAAYAGVVTAAGLHARPATAAGRAVTHASRLPRIVVRPSHGVDSKLDRSTATQIAADVVADLQSRRLPFARPRRIALWLEAGTGQGPAIVARLEGGAREATVEVSQSLGGYRIARVRP
jgi:hypothetical protein